MDCLPKDNEVIKKRTMINNDNSDESYLDHLDEMDFQDNVFFQTFTPKK